MGGRIRMASTKQLDEMLSVRSVSPNSLRVSAYNERAAATGATDGRTSFEVSSELKNSIRETGLVDPPLVRKTENPDYDYEVVVGARRVRAVQHLLADDELPGDYNISVLVTDWDDFDSLRASISENIEAFRKDVSPSLRCKATVKLWEMAKADAREEDIEEPAYTDFIVNSLGVARSTAALWFERANEPWPNASRPVEVEPVFKDKTTAKTRKTNSDRLGSRPTTTTRSSSTPSTASGFGRNVDREDAAKQIAKAKSKVTGRTPSPVPKPVKEDSNEKDDELFVLPPRYDFISDSKLAILRRMILNQTDDPSEQKAWARRCLDKLEEFHAAAADSEKPHITFDFADKDAREAHGVIGRQNLTPTEALDWAWKRKTEGAAEQKYGSARVRFSLRGEDKVRLEFLAALERTTKEEAARVALQQYLTENRELAQIGLSVKEMDDLLKSNKNEPSKLADLHEEGQL